MSQEFEDRCVEALEDIMKEVLETLTEPSIKWKGGLQHIASIAQRALSHTEAARFRQIQRMRSIVKGGPIMLADEVITDEGQYRRAVRDCLIAIGEKV